MDLTQLRVAAADALEGAGVRAAEYLGETLSPPCAVVVPGRPYTRGPGPTAPGVPFGHRQVRLDVLLLTTRDGAKSDARRIDDLIETACAALDEYDITEVSQPGVVTHSGAKFIGSVITIEEVTKGP